jgi:hypothetical protein
MYNKLKNFALDQESHNTSAKVLERFTFWRKEKHRSKCLEQLRIWNKRLGRLIENAQSGALATTAVGQPGIVMQSASSVSRTSPNQLQKIPLLLYRALSQCWDCCTTRHEAKICLKLQEDESFQNDGAGEFDVLISLEGRNGSQWAWQEGFVIVRSEW